MLVWDFEKAVGERVGVRGNAVKHFRTENQAVPAFLYAEGVVLQSPGSAQPRSGGAPPWGTRLTFVGYAEGVIQSAHSCGTPSAYGFCGEFNPGCAVDHGYAVVPATLGFGI